MGNAINKLTIKGYKSIRNLENFELRNINILIGPNGSGKSNFIDFFSFLREISKGRLQHFVAYLGGADKILYLGLKVTKELIGSIESSNERVSWEFKLFTSKVDKLLFYEEAITGGTSSLSTKWAKEYEHGLSESDLFSKGSKDHDEYVEKIRNQIQPVIEDWVPYHFHDTSDFAGVKRPCTKRDYEYLRPDASNLAAFLLFLRKKHVKEYQDIRETIQLAAPFFEDFLLKDSLDNPDETLLEWCQKGSDYPFHPSQISDGTLRFICLATVLLQPNLPSTLLLDEPELGLHPYALTLLSALIQKASRRSQVIVSTQSAMLIDNFEPEDIVVVERQNGESIFKRLNNKDLKIWLDDYSLGELWQQNVFGGRPSYE
ncbi:MAG: AAA family ATPase [Sedimentisphaerales bacterium]|nr:AAA family ATPase [Sedimentisphaerales bacterium]